jgi:hypothetical protein
MTMYAALLTLLLCIGGALVTGSALARQVDEDFLGVERLISAFLLGAGLIGLAVFLVGLVRLERVAIALILAAAYTPLVSSGIRSWLRDTLRSVSAGFSWAFLGHLAILGMLFLAAVPRPTGDIRNDAIGYHLLGPAVWLRTGRIVPVLDYSPTAFPALIESLFSAGMAFSNDRFPAMLGVVFASVLLGQIYGFARALGATKATATLMSFLAACAPAVVSYAPNGLVDIAYASFSLAAVRLLLLGEHSTSRAAVGGVLLGFALGVKYTAIPLVAITLVVLLYAHARRSTSLASLRSAALAMAIAAVVGSPFYLKNLILLGSPIYPPPVVLARWFHARAFSIDASSELQRAIVEYGRGLGRGPLDFLLLPWRYTLFTDRFRGAGGIGAAPLALGLIGAAAIRGRPSVSALLMWMGLVTLVWFLTQQESRFLIHVVALSFAFAAVGGTWLKREWTRAGQVIVVLVAVVSGGYGLLVLVGQNRDRVAAALSRTAEASFRRRDVPYLEAWDYLNRDPGVQCVLILEELAPQYYLNKDYVKVRGGYGERPLPGIENTSEALAHLRELRVTHVLDVVAPEWAQHRGFQIDSAPDLRLAFHSNRSRVYEVLARPREDGSVAQAENAHGSNAPTCRNEPPPTARDR